MESLRGAADKIKKSPRVVRKKINAALHKEKLSEDWIHNREQVELGVMFNIKVLGRETTDVQQGKGCTDKIVEELVQRHKANAKTEKLQKVSILIDCEKVIVRDLASHEVVDDISVKDICFCTADQTYPKVFAFMVSERDAGSYVYVFLTNKKAMADAIALTIAQAYTMSYEIEEEKATETETKMADEYNGGMKEVDEIQSKMAKTELSVPSIENTVTDSTLPDDEEDEFLILAQSRKELDIGHVRREEFPSDISAFLAVNNTVTDLERAKSHDDLLGDGDGRRSPRHLSGRSSPVVIPPTTQNVDLIQF